MSYFILTSPCEQRADDEDENIMFKSSLLYKYMVYTFQYVDPDAANYKCRRNLRFFQMCRLLISILISSFIGFIFYYTVIEIDQHVDFRKSRDIATFVRTVKNIWENFDYYIGLYLFSKYPDKVEEELKEMKQLCDNDTEKRKLRKNLRRNEKNMQKFLIFFFSLFVFLRIVGTVVYCILDDGHSIRKVIYIFVSIHRLLSLSFLIYFVFIARLLKLKIRFFTETLQSKSFDIQKGKIICKWLDICDSVRKTSNNYHLYIIFLVISLCLKVMRSTNVISSDIMMIRAINNKAAAEIAYHVIITVWTVCDIILNVVVLKVLSNVSEAQKNFLSTMLRNKNEQNDSHHILFEIVAYLKTYHQLEGIGYTVFGIPISAMRALLFSAFISLSAFLGGILFRT